MRQMVFEGLVVSLGGGALAVLLTLLTSKSLSGLIPPNANPTALNGYVDANVIGAIVGLALATSMICGALPAWPSSHVAAVEALKEESANVSGGGQNRRLLSGLVVAQIALSLALLVTSGLFLRTLRAESEADPGFEQAHVLTAAIDLSAAGYSGDETRILQHKLYDKLQAIPRITSASITDWLPMSFQHKPAEAYPEGYVPQPHESTEVRRADVSASYFETLNIPILQGRAFTVDDNETAPRVAIVDETAAHRYWPGQNPLGKKLMVWRDPYTIVGVARNTKHQFVKEAPEPLLYLPYFQASDTETIIQVGTRGDPRNLAPSIEEAVHQINAKVPLTDVRALYETTQVSTSFARIQALFATVFGLLALALASTGIYGLVAYRTQLRTHEIGIRVALGASRADVLRLVLGQGLRLTARRAGTRFAGLDAFDTLPARASLWCIGDRSADRCLRHRAAVGDRGGCLPAAGSESDPRRSRGRNPSAVKVD